MYRAAVRAALCAGTALLAVTTMASAPPAHADTLRDALASAYRTNPTLESARASQRANDENVPIEKADGRPTANGQGSYTEFLDKGDSAATSPDRSLNATVTLNVPIYRGGGVKNAVKAAETRVEAGQADLRGTESMIFSQVVSTYMDVIANEAIVRLNRNQVDVLRVNLDATRDRYEIGDLTRTDVAQSQSRLSLAQGDARIAEANLATARESYIRLVGKAPVDLQPPPPLPNLPETPEFAVAAAMDNNPDIIAARIRSKAAEYDIRVAGATRLPRIDVYTQGGYQDYLGTLGGNSSGVFSQSETTAQAGVRATIPIFQGGFPAALRRQSQARASATFEQEIAVERDVIAQARAAFSTWRAANEVTVSAQTAVDAAGISLEGVRAENSVGNRTILDILDAEQELVRAQSRLIQARRSAYVAAFSLLAAMGRAEARDLNLDAGPLYDPDVNYQRVRGKWFDWDDDAAPVVKSTRTVDTPVQDGSVVAQ